MRDKMRKMGRVGMVLVGVLSVICVAENLLVEALEEGKLERSDLFLFQETFTPDKKIESIMDDVSRVDNAIRLELSTTKDNVVDINQSEFVKKENWLGAWKNYPKGNKAKLTFEFTGTKLEMLSSLNVKGKIRIKIDGEEAGDLGGWGYLPRKIIPIVSGLENKLHTVEVHPEGYVIIGGFILSTEEYPSSGTLLSPPIILPDNLKWGKVFYKRDTPEETSIKIDVLDLKDKVLLSNISEKTDLSRLDCRGIKLKASFSTSNLYLTPSLKEWSISYIGKPEIKGALSGIVINSEGKGIKDASISVFKDGALQLEAKTSSKGEYSILKLNHGRYSLQISAFGYLSNIFEADVPSSLSYNFLLYKESEIPDCRVWSVNPLTNILKKDKPSKEDVKEVHIEAAGNEYEPFQIVVAPSSALRLKVKPSSLTHASGKYVVDKNNVTSNFIGYVPVRCTYRRVTGAIAKAPIDMPDPLLLDGQRLLKKNENHPVWITVKTPEDALPGDYKGDIELITQYGIIKKVKLNLHIYPFQLKDASEEPHVWATNYDGIGFKLISSYYDLKPQSPEWWKFYKEVAVKNRVEHRMNCVTFDAWHGFIQAYYSKADKSYSCDFTNFDRFIELFPEKTKIILPGGIWRALDWKIRVKEGGIKRLKRTMDLSHPGVMDFILAFHVDLEKHLEEKGWLDKVWITFWDEAKDVEYYQKYSAKIHKVAPKLYRFEFAQPEGIEDAVDTICKGITGRPDEKLYNRLREKGKDGWIYSTGPAYSYPDISIEIPLIRARLIPWVLYRYGFKGHHHSGWTQWLCDPWRVPNASSSRLYNTTPGNYYLVYPDPEKKTIINSLRYEVLREGFEDYEYLWTLANTGEEIAKKLGWHKNPALIKAKAFAKEIFPSYDMYKQDPEQLYRIRRKVAQEICRLKERPCLIVNLEPSPTVGPVPPGIIKIEGMTEKGCELFIDGKRVKLSPKGEFSIQSGITHSKNYIDVLAKKDSKEKRIREIFTLSLQDTKEEELEEAINRIENLGVEASSSRNILQRYQVAAKKSSQPEEIITLSNEVNSETKKLHQQEIDILFEKVSSRGRGRTKLYRDMIKEIKRYYKSGDYTDRRFLLTEALRLDEGCAKREEGNCFIIPFFHHKRKAYKLINSKIEAIIWKEGGRIITFKVNGVPALKHNQIDVLGKMRINVGGYEDAGKLWRWVSNLEEWEAEIVKDNPEEVVLSCSKAVSKPGEEGYLIKRVMSIRKNDPGLKISYTISNPTDKPCDYTWRAHTILGIGKAKENEGGDPSGDEFIIPTSEKLPHLECDSYKTYKKGFDKMFILNKPFAGVIDREEKTSIFFLIDPLIRKLYFWCGGGKSGYTFEPWLEFSLGGGDSITFGIYLVGFSGITNPGEARTKIEDYLGKIR